jgi:hypothetical protein
MDLQETFIVQNLESFQSVALKRAFTVQNLELFYRVALKKTLTVQNLELFNVFDGYFKTAPTFAQSLEILPD